MDTEQKIQHIKDLAKAGAKKYYEKNKEKILLKKKEEREQLNETIQELKEKQKIPVIVTAPDELVVHISSTADYAREGIIELIKQQNYEYDTQKTYTVDVNCIF